jgi:hypothetical protein
MATSTSGAGTPSGNPLSITEIAPDVVTIGPDYNVGGIAFEVFDSNANAGFRTMLDPGDALDAALRLVGSVLRLHRLITPVIPT